MPRESVATVEPHFLGLEAASDAHERGAEGATLTAGACGGAEIEAVEEEAAKGGATAAGGG